MNLAIIGCGYVADLYGITLRHHPELRLVGAYDRNEKNLMAFCKRWGVTSFSSLEAVLEDRSVEMLLNLTNPRSHYEVTRRCLEAGKHVYSEKPLAMDTGGAYELVRLAESRGLYLSAAPCSLLSETAQTMWKALRDGVIGKVRLVYANFDDGMIAPKLSPWNWTNGCGVQWPAKDEFEVGCTYEHAGYVLTWLAAFFGPAKAVTSFASCQIPEKGIAVEKMAPDFSVGCIEYANNVVARVTCGLVAPKDKSLTIVGDEGVLSTANVRHDASPVFIRKTPADGRHAGLERRLNAVRRWLELKCDLAVWSGNEWRLRRKLPFAMKPTLWFSSEAKRVDFFRGPAEMADAIQGKRRCRLSAELGVHIVELIETLQHPEKFGCRREIGSSFEPIEPLSWQVQV